MFPKEGDPTGGMLPFLVSLALLKEVADPEKWTREELRRWLAAVSPINFPFTGKAPLVIIWCYAIGGFSYFTKLSAQHETWPRDTNFVRSWRKWELAIRSLYWYASYREICIQARKIPTNSCLNEWRQIWGLQGLRPDIFWTFFKGEPGVSIGSWARKHTGIQSKVSSSYC
jgi:hypothetical protein